MICLMPKPNLKKYSEIIGVYLGPTSSPVVKPLYYAIYSVLKNKTNATSHSNIGSLKIALKE